MRQDWLVTPQFFEIGEPGIAEAAPDGAAVNAPEGVSDRSPESLARLYAPIADFVARSVGDGARPVSLAGDCCAAVPVLSGLQASGVAPQVVWVDAHGDFNTPETSPSQFLGGMPLAMMVGRGPQWMMQGVGARPIAESAVTAAGLRDLDPLEREALRGSAVRMVDLAALAGLRIDAPVHLHVDLDVIDAEEAPAFRYAVAGGPSAAETADALAAFAAANTIAAISFSAWSPSLDPDGATLAACRTVIEAATAA